MTKPLRVVRVAVTFYEEPRKSIALPVWRRVHSHRADEDLEARVTPSEHPRHHSDRRRPAEPKLHVWCARLNAFGSPGTNYLGLQGALASDTMYAAPPTIDGAPARETRDFPPTGKKPCLGPATRHGTSLTHESGPLSRNDRAPIQNRASLSRLPSVPLIRAPRSRQDIFAQLCRTPVRPTRVPSRRISK